MSPYRSLICLALLHTLVDACAILIGPLWGDLKVKYAMGQTTLFVVLTVQGLSPSLSQVVFGYLRDRYPIRSVLWMGPVVAAVCLSLVGLVSHLGLLCGLLILGGVGVGAFHPEAAVAAGRILPGERTRGLSLFLFGGALGLGLGPILSGAVVGQWGLAGLVVIGPPFVLIVAATTFIGRLGTVAETPVPDGPRASLAGMLEGRTAFACFLLAVCSLRLVPNMAMDKLLSFMLAADGESPFTIGLVQSVFLVSASAGMLLMAYRFRTGWERTFLVWCPILGIPILFALGQADLPRWLLLTLLVPAGLILWGTTPVMVSYAHQQFPRGAGLASALTMGLSWGVGGLIQARITSTFVDSGAAHGAFHAFIPCLALAALGSFFLPDAAPETELSPDAEPAMHTAVESPSAVQSAASDA